MSHHAEAPDFLHGIVGIGDHPVARDQLSGHAPGVANSYGVGPHVTRRSGIRLVWEVLRLDLDGKGIGVHFRIVNQALERRSYNRV